MLVHTNYQSSAHHTSMEFQQNEQDDLTNFRLILAFVKALVLSRNLSH